MSAATNADPTELKAKSQHFPSPPEDKELPWRIKFVQQPFNDSSWTIFSFNVGTDSK
jgi:hypothetical protein